MANTDSDAPHRRRVEPATKQAPAVTVKAAAAAAAANAPMHGERPRHTRRENFIRQVQRESTYFMRFISAIALISVAVLWFMGVLGSGKWDEDPKSPVKFVKFREQWDTVLRESTKPILLAFYSESCPSCKRMRVPFMHAAAHPDSTGVQFVAINAGYEEMSKLADTMNINHVPTLLFFSSPTANPILYDGSATESKLLRFIRISASDAEKKRLEQAQKDQHEKSKM